jgi:methylated-DNA-[protein]-cysteine S-methyltransferase
MNATELPSDLLQTALFDSEDEELARLHARLAAHAQNEGLLDIAYRTVDSPVGSLLLAASPAGLMKVAFEVQDHDAVLTALAEKVSPRILRAPDRLDPVARQLDEYFGGTRRAFDLALDWRLSAGFRRQVLDHLTHIGYGHTESYAEVAAGAGNPKAVRAVGSACATIPLVVVVPCHRVVRSDGSAGGYAGGVEAKAALLALEAA